MLRSFRLGAAVAASAAALLVLSGCSAPAETSSGTVTEGKLTIATGEPAYSPWVEDNDPSSGKGFEAAVAYAVAEELGFDKKDVEWVRTSFDAAIAPGPKDFDLNLQQYTASEERKAAVDFSSPYYVTTQTVIAVEGTPAAAATDLAGLKDAVIGVAAASTSLGIVEETIAPSTGVQVFNSNDDAIAALNAGQIDALVTDLPTSFYIVGSEQVENGTIVGQLDSTKGGDELAILLPKGSALTGKVTAAVDALRADGTLDKLAATWFADQGAPVLK